MSQKDKNTLIIVGIALLIFGIAFLGIKPAFTSIKETKATNAELSAKKQEMKTEIEALPTYQADLKTAIIDYNKTGSRVFNAPTNDLIHDEVVAFVKDLGLTITSLQIGEISPMTPQNYSVTEDGVTGGMTEGTIKVSSINITVSGTYKQVLQLVDFLNTNEGTMIQTISFANNGTELTVGVPFYMIIADEYSAK